MVLGKMDFLCQKVHWSGCIFFRYMYVYIFICVWRSKDKIRLILSFLSSLSFLCCCHRSEYYCNYRRRSYRGWGIYARYENLLIRSTSMDRSTLFVSGKKGKIFTETLLEKYMYNEWFQMSSVDLLCIMISLGSCLCTNNAWRGKGNLG